jgi:transcriptional regulator with XRE-family HTH domain
MDNGIPNSKKFLQALGKRISDLRQEKGWSLNALAEMAKLSANDLGEIERGELDPSVETMLRIARALKMDVATLCEGVD